MTRSTLVALGVPLRAFRTELVAERILGPAGSVQPDAAWRCAGCADARCGSIRGPPEFFGSARAGSIVPGPFGGIQPQPGRRCPSDPYLDRHECCNLAAREASQVEDVWTAPSASASRRRRSRRQPHLSMVPRPSRRAQGHPRWSWSRVQMGKGIQHRGQSDTNMLAILRAEWRGLARSQAGAPRTAAGLRAAFWPRRGGCVLPSLIRPAPVLLQRSSATLLYATASEAVISRLVFPSAKRCRTWMRVGG